MDPSFDDAVLELPGAARAAAAPAPQFLSAGFALLKLHRAVFTAEAPDAVSFLL